LLSPPDLKLKGIYTNSQVFSAFYIKILEENFGKIDLEPKLQAL
jgi:hypothetical protein